MPRIVFLCRGHGYGHAARDLAVVTALRALRPDAEVLLASSGTGLDYFRRRSVGCANLGISDEEDQTLDAARRVLRFLGRVGRPDLVVADEVFCAPALCRGLGVPNLLLTDFFWADAGRPHLDRVCADADAVVLLDAPSTHRLPTDLAVPVHVTGPVAAAFPLTRDQARRRLGVSGAELVVVAAFGSPHQNKPPFVRALLGTVLAAWRGHAPDRRAVLFLLAEPVPGLAGGDTAPAVTWTGVTTEPETYYRAADLVFAWAGLATLSELVRNAVPTVCFTGENEGVEMRTRTVHWESAGAIRRADLRADPAELWRLGERARADRARQPGAGAAVPTWADPADVARLVLAHLPPPGPHPGPAPGPGHRPADVAAG
jgi:hypothetical protein